MKVLIIEFSMFNGINMMYATHYYINGKRVSRNSYYQMDTWIHHDFVHDHTRQWHDKNKNGVDRDYTEIVYKEKENKNLTIGW